METSNTQPKDNAMSTKTYLVIERKAGDTEHVDVSDKPWAMMLDANGPQRDRMLGQLRDANARKGDKVIDAYTVNTDEAADKAASEVNKLRNAARQARINGQYINERKLDAQADAADKAYREQHPEHAADADALLADLSDANEARRRDDYDASLIRRGIA